MECSRKKENRREIKIRSARKNLNFFCKDPKEMKKADIRNAVTFPRTILHLLLKGKKPHRALIEDALKSIDHAVELLKKF